jgi:LPXTG-motif cell wall-anchored protein
MALRYWPPYGGYRRGLGDDMGPPAPPGSIVTPGGVTLVPMPWYKEHEKALVIGGLAAGALFLLSRKRRRR